MNPGGFVTQWVPLYESTVDVVKSEVATFFDVFPDGSIWSNDDAGRGYDTVMLGHAGPSPINVDEMEARLQRPDYLAVSESLRDVQFHSAQELLATFAGQAENLKPWLKNAQINLDRDLRLQYLAGFGNNLYQEGEIYNEMVLFRKYPEGLFIGSDDRKDALRLAIGHFKQ